MAFGDAEDHETVEQTMNEAECGAVGAGDECPESDCEEELFELRHERDNRDVELDEIGTVPVVAPNHPDAPEREVVCIHHGVVRAE